MRSIINSLKKEEADALRSAVHNIKSKQPGYTVGWLMKVLSSEGISISDMSIYRHVNGRCSCGAE